MDKTEQSKNWCGNGVAHILFIYKLKKKYIYLYIRADCSIGCGRPSSAIKIITIFPAFCARTIVFLIFFVVRAKSISQFVSSCAAHFTDRPHEFVCFSVDYAYDVVRT